MGYKINQIDYSEREIAIISCICNGCSSKTIANILNISPYTVDSHIKKIKWKMNCFSREAIIRSVESSEEYPCIQAKYVEIRKISVCCEKISKQEERQDTEEGGKKYSNIIAYSKKYILPLVLLLTIGVFSNVYTDDTELSYEIQLPNERILLPREEIKRKIDKALRSRNGLNFVVLVGEAGIGKTTIARHYIKNGNFSVKAEIDAESTFKIIESFENLVFLLSKSDEQLKTLQFIKSINKKSDKRKKLKILLANLLKGYKSWCLIYDDAENLDLLKKWLPLDNSLFHKGNVIITTRNWKVENFIFPYQLNIINVKQLTDKESEKLFYSIINKENHGCSKDLIKLLLKKIHATPLDISSLHIL